MMKRILYWGFLFWGTALLAQAPAPIAVSAGYSSSTVVMSPDSMEELYYCQGPHTRSAVILFDIDSTCAFVNPRFQSPFSFANCKRAALGALQKLEADYRRTTTKHCTPIFNVRYAFEFTCDHRHAIK